MLCNMVSLLYSYPENWSRPALMFHLAFEKWTQGLDIGGSYDRHAMKQWISLES